MKKILVWTVLPLLGAVLIVTLALLLSRSEPSSTTASSGVSKAQSVLQSPAPHAEALRETGDKAVNNSSPARWMMVTTGVMALVTLVAVLIAFYLYRWRRIFIGQTQVVVPEEWASFLRDVGRAMHGLHKQQQQTVAEVSGNAAEGNRKISDLLESFMTLQSALDERDAEIRRYKKGYDAEVFRKFLLRFIRVDESIDELLGCEQVTVDDLRQIKRLLEDAFDECGVEMFAPNVGDDYRAAQGLADNPKTIAALNPDDNFKVAEVTRVGYRLRGSDGQGTIIPARVKIFMSAQ